MRRHRSDSLGDFLGFSFAQFLPLGMVPTGAYNSHIWDSLGSSMILNHLGSKCEKQLRGTAPLMPRQGSRQRPRWGRTQLSPSGTLIRKEQPAKTWPKCGLCSHQCSGHVQRLDGGHLAGWGEQGETTGLHKQKCAPVPHTHKRKTASSQHTGLFPTHTPFLLQFVTLLEEASALATSWSPASVMMTPGKKALLPRPWPADSGPVSTGRCCAVAKQAFQKLL